MNTASCSGRREVNHNTRGEPLGVRPAPRFLPNSIVLLLALAVVALGAVGCGTFDKQKAEKFASVKIHATSEREVRTAIADVFRDHEFKVILTKTNVICEKEGSAGDNFLYGNWVGGEPVWVRIKLTIVPMMEGAYRLQCLAFKVRDKGSFAFEEEVQVSGMGSHHYQKLLDEVAERFKGTPRPP